MANWVKVHPLVVRITHWINVLAVLMMVTSGWRIYNASPLFDFRFPTELTLGGWLAGALQWHFAAMWLLAINGLVYVVYGIVSGHEHVLYQFFVQSPDFALPRQLLLLLVVWLHGCIGLRAWLRYRPWYARATPVLASLAKISMGTR